MRKNKFNFFRFKESSSKLRLYAYITWYFYSITGINCVIASFLNRSLFYNCIVLGFVFFSLIPITIISPRKVDRNLGAVVSSIILCLIITVALTIILQCWYMFIVLIIEILISFPYTYCAKKFRW